MEVCFEKLIVQIWALGKPVSTLLARDNHLGEGEGLKRYHRVAPHPSGGCSKGTGSAMFKAPRVEPLIYGLVELESYMKHLAVPDTLNCNEGRRGSRSQSIRK